MKADKTLWGVAPRQDIHVGEANIATLFRPVKAGERSGRSRGHVASSRGAAPQMTLLYGRKDGSP